MTLHQSIPLPGRAARGLACAALLALSPLAVWAQVSVEAIPPDMVQSDHAGTPAAPVDLGQSNFGSAAGAAQTAAAAEPTYAGSAPGTALQAAAAARAATRTHTRRPPPTAAQRAVGVERAVFERQPVRVPLPIGRERLITLPAPAALHVPADMAQVARIETIDRTIYVTALVPFTPIRIVAELIDSGQQIPMDFVADSKTAGAVAELEISTVEAVPVSADAAGVPDDDAPGATAAAAPKAEPPDMVELTRHAARQLYAPRRLAWATPGVKQVGVSTAPVEGLIPGLNVETAPLGEWQGGRLYVTAVRVTNRSKHPVEIPLENFRGQWLAATAQHGRLGAAGSEADTTAVYLVCDREFLACLR